MGSDNTWYTRSEGLNRWMGCDIHAQLPAADPAFGPEVVETEQKVGEIMLGELIGLLEGADRIVNVAILGGRGAQAMHRIIGSLAPTGKLDNLLSRLHIWMQDALWPLPADNAFSFVRDFERLLGMHFFEHIHGFSSFDSETKDPESQAIAYARSLEQAGGIDLFFLGHGPEAASASHVAYIKPNAGARASDWVGVIPLSDSILEHHISKFKAGGAATSDLDERDCRTATHVVTLGPATILGAKRVIQSVVDAGTAPAKVASYRRVLDTRIAGNAENRARQLDENPGLYARLHPSIRSLILPDVLGQIT